jgi:VWFA-related protein
MKINRFSKIISVVFLIPFLFILVSAQKNNQKNLDNSEQKVRTVTIPISIFTKRELKENQTEEFIQADRLIVEEDGDEQTILSIRSVTTTSLALAVLIQDDLSSEANLQLQNTKQFIRGLPKGSRVMVAYLRGGTMDIRQKFTEDLNKAADSIRIIIGSASVAPRSPYDGVIDTLKRFDALPTGRRAILLISDGLDVSGGLSNSSPTQSIDLDEAILKSQRRGVAVYSFYASGSLTSQGNSQLINYGQSSLLRISEETGGRAFFSGSFTAVSFEPFFKELGLLLNRQFALTYLSTHLKKGYHRVKVMSTNPEVKIEHPRGYYYR